MILKIFLTLKQIFGWVIDNLQKLFLLNMILFLSVLSDIKKSNIIATPEFFN